MQNPRPLHALISLYLRRVGKKKLASQLYDFATTSHNIKKIRFLQTRFKNSHLKEQKRFSEKTTKTDRSLCRLVRVLINLIENFHARLIEKRPQLQKIMRKESYQKFHFKRTEKKKCLILERVIKLYWRRGKFHTKKFIHFLWKQLNTWQLRSCMRRKPYTDI